MERFWNKFKKYHIIRGAFSKLVVLLVLFGLVPMILLTVLSYHASRKIITQQILRLNQAAFSDLDIRISSFANSLYTMNALCILDEQIQREVVKIYDYPTNEQIINTKAIEDKLKQFSLIMGNSDFQLTIMGRGGLEAYCGTRTPRVTYEELKDQTWCQELLKSGSQSLWLIGNPLSGNEEEHVLTFVSVIPTLGSGIPIPKSGKEGGLFFFTMTEEMLYQQYERLLSAGIEISLADGQGRYISSSHKELLGDSLTEEQLSVMLSFPGDREKIIEDRDRITIVKKLEKADWYCMYTINTFQSLKEVRSLYRQFVGLLVFSVAFYIVLSAVIINIFTRPLIKLNKKFASHFKEKNSNTGSKTGQGELYYNYELLIQTLDHTVQELLKNENAKRLAELSALQMQINPHFLYNTLNTIKCLSWTGQTEKIVPTTDALISLFRQTIGTAETVIPLREELECVKNYVFLQQMRTGHGLELTVHQSENTAEALVPKLLLQPIVENAVFHGIEPRGTDGRITVFVSKAGSILNIEIDDDGVGMDENTLREFEHASGGGARFSGVGINNIRERIRLMYGEEYGISITSQPGMGTQIVIRIPYYTDKRGI